MNDLDLDRLDPVEHARRLVSASRQLDRLGHGTRPMRDARHATIAALFDAAHMTPDTLVARLDQESSVRRAARRAHASTSILIPDAATPRLIRAALDLRDAIRAVIQRIDERNAMRKAG